MSIKHCTVIDNSFQDHKVIYAFNMCILNVSQSTFANNSVKSSAMIMLQSSHLLLHGSIIISDNECSFGVLFVSRSLVQSNSELSIMANKATLHTVYIAQNKLLLINKLQYSRNHGTLLIIESLATFSGTNVFTLH